eukprot:TRINITY_DN90921_c0_g1_i1.p1 TRINITY_DN90921_c0_g1~~TRINITY_DN90921_c0_g1_i1.p1  ORF type:complete len:1336 (+),score=212.36 TRINITY_DN90921_c0_g1_i1:33-4010(+)
MASSRRRTLARHCKLRLNDKWTDLEVCSDVRPPELVVTAGLGAVLQGGLSSSRAVKPGSWPLGKLEASDGVEACCPPVAVQSVVLAAPERPDREDLPKYDRAALVDVSEAGNVTLVQGDGAVARIQLGSVSWLRTDLQELVLDSELLDILGESATTAAQNCSAGCRRSETFVFCEGALPGFACSQVEDVVVAKMPPNCRPEGGRRSYLCLCFCEGCIHVLHLGLDSSGQLSARRSHTQGRARDGHSFDVQKRAVSLEAPLGSVRFVLAPGRAIELLSGARPPRQHAARKQLAYLGLQDDVTDSEGAGHSSPHELDGFQVATCSREGNLVLLDGAVLLSARHRYTAFARLPPDCRPDQRVTLLVARGLPCSRLELERLDVTPEGECLCPQLPEEAGLEHAVHLQGVVFGVSSVPDEESCPASEEKEKGACYEDCMQNADEKGENTHETAWKRLQELEARDRRFRGKFSSAGEFIEFERYLQWFRAHDCTESHRLTHSCFKGRSDFTQTGMLVFDTEEDLEGLNKAIAWLYDKRIPVVLMERQTRIFPLIFDIDLKVTKQEILDSVPWRIKKNRPWRGSVDFCRWPGSDWLVLSEDLMLLRNLGVIIFQFFPDLPLIDICVFNASGWDRVKDFVKVSIHLVAPYVLVTPERLTAIRERMLEYLGECSECEGHRLKSLLDTFLAESEDNTWDKVVDQTVTSGTNGLRMPYCDKAQRVLKREFAERKRQGEVFTERELMDMHAYLKEEAGRPCLPEGILRLIPPAKGPDDEFTLPEARWMCRGSDLPIDEWIRLGRCRYAWRLPLSPPGPTPWRPPLCYQWAEPPALWEDRVQLKGSPVVRRFNGTAAEFRACWEEASGESSKLQGRWLNSSSDARWRGGLTETSTHEVRYILRSGRVVLLLSPEPGAARTFTEIRKVLAGWTHPDDYGCVPICGAPSDSHSSALHTIVSPSEEFPDIQTALDAVPEDEPLHRVLLRAGTHELPETLLVTRPVLLEGEGKWDTILRTRNAAVLRIQGSGASAMVRNLCLRTCAESGEEGAPAIDILSNEGEPAIVGCKLAAEGRWGTCIRSNGGAPQIVRNYISNARWGLVLVGTGGRVEDNDIRGLGESGLVLVSGSTWVHRNHISDCSGPGVLAASDCRAVLQENDIRDCMSGVRVVGKRSEIQMRAGNRLLHSGLCDEHQLESPPGVIPSGATATVRSCRPYPFVPKDRDELLRRMQSCKEHTELVILLRAARRRGHWAKARIAHRRLTELRRITPKSPAPSVAPAIREVAVASKAWDGVASGFSENCVAVFPGTLCEVIRRDESGWILVNTSLNSRGWCSPHVFN